MKKQVLAYAPKRVIYLPLEAYEERYTKQLSGTHTEKGWFESAMDEHQIPYMSIRGEPKDGKINNGKVLDAVGRSQWCAEQLIALYKLINAKVINPLTDVIYFDDFWHPGIESIPYIFSQMGDGYIPRMYAYCWAQSVDRWDFTHAMQSWMRPFEVGIGKVLDGIFVANSMLQELLDAASIGSHKIHVTGLPFNSKQVLSMMDLSKKKKNQAVFTSRFDYEKRPDLFVKIAKAYGKLYPESDMKFIICSSGRIKTDTPYRSETFMDAVGADIEILEGLSKQQYYNILTESKFQINTSLQDWVSYTMLEAACANCGLIYPTHRSFPETFSNSLKANGMYSVLDIQNATAMAEAIRDTEDSPDYANPLPDSHEETYKTHDLSIKRILHHIGFSVGHVDLNPYHALTA